MKGFLDKKNIMAVVGASNNKNKWGWKIYSKLLSSGFDVYPVNPKHEKIGNRKCYPDLKSLPKKPDVVITVVPPAVTDNVVKTCAEIGVKMIWMQPGSESDDAIRFCRDKGVAVMHHACIVVDGMKKKW